MTLPAHERESLEEDLHDVARDAEDIRTQARLLLNRQPSNTAIREVYAEKAAYLMDLADDLEFAKVFRDIRHELDEAEQSEAHAERMADIAACNARRV
jgi:hypothetical protein